MVRPRVDYALHDYFHPTDAVPLSTIFFNDTGSDHIAARITNLVESPPLLGDVNQDGEVNLLDVAPFVDLVGNGDFQIEGDINQDGVVNLLDVAPFVEILSGG